MRKAAFPLCCVHSLGGYGRKRMQCEFQATAYSTLLEPESQQSVQYLESLTTEPPAAEGNPRL